MLVKYTRFFTVFLLDGLDGTATELPELVDRGARLKVAAERSEFEAEA